MSHNCFTIHLVLLLETEWDTDEVAGEGETLQTASQLQSLRSVASDVETRAGQIAPDLIPLVDYQFALSLGDHLFHSIFGQPAGGVQTQIDSLHLDLQAGACW